jgi:hypothetical protein
VSRTRATAALLAVTCRVASAPRCSGLIPERWSSSGDAYASPRRIGKQLEVSAGGPFSRGTRALDRRAKRRAETLSAFGGLAPARDCNRSILELRHDDQSTAIAQ